MLAWLKGWGERRAIRKLVRKMGPSLKHRYGFQEFYTSGQVLKTEELMGLDKEGQAYAVAMYVQPEDAIRIPTKMRDAKWADSLRSFMIGQCFGFSGGTGGSANYNVFMHHNAGGSHHGINHAGGFFDSSHHSSDGGNSPGEYSGGHH
jgi:hypothetical protein